MFPLLKKGRTFRNGLFSLKFVNIAAEEKEGLSVPPQVETFKGSRFCFSVSKKVAKNATTRNKIRRAGYRLLKKHLSEIRPNILALFSFKTIPPNNENITENLESILKKSGLLE